MGYNRFYIYVVLHIIGIIATTAVLSFLYIKQLKPVLAFNIMLVLIIQVVFAIHFIKRFYKKVSSHIECLINNDLSLFPKRKSKIAPFEEINRNLEILYHKIEKAEIEKTVESEYHKYSVDHIAIGLISYNKSNGEIKYINKAAKKLLSIASADNIQNIILGYKELEGPFQLLKPGKSALIKIIINNELVILSIKVTEFVLMKEKIRLISLYNIKDEIEASELESWQKLIRILTHEIMNSVAPIASATKSLQMFLTDNGKAKNSSQISDKIIEDASIGLDAIKTRSDGLLDFVSKYRNLTNVPQPNFNEVLIKDIFNHINVLFQNQFEKNIIEFIEIIENDEIKIFADINLIEQTIINLIQNSIFALDQTKHKKIQIKAYTREDKTYISVHDNGKGIKVGDLDKVFIPFYSTRKGGSGIGLSLARQIMQLHNGSIYVKSIPEEETIFTLEF